MAIEETGNSHKTLEPSRRPNFRHLGVAGWGPFTVVLAQFSIQPVFLWLMHVSMALSEHIVPIVVVRGCWVLIIFSRAPINLGEISDFDGWISWNSQMFPSPIARQELVASDAETLVRRPGRDLGETWERPWRSVKGQQLDAQFLISQCWRGYRWFLSGLLMSRFPARVQLNRRKPWWIERVNQI